VSRSQLDRLTFAQVYRAQLRAIELGLVPIPAQKEQNGCVMRPCGMVNMVGMMTVYDGSSYWGTVTKDAQLLTIATYVKERFLDRGLQGMLGGEGFHSYPDPAYAAPDFLAVPDASRVPAIVARLGTNPR
jgi:3-hydroxybutyryl-CoA dehydrogenase